MDLLNEKPIGEEIIQVVVGTYEEYLIGYSIYFDDNTGKIKFHQKFTNHAHSGSVKKISCSQNGLLVSGGTDENCCLINLRKFKEVGNLIEHEGAISDLEFHKNKFLFSASEDNSICVWNMSTTSCDKKLIGHKQGINSLSVHPSGKLLLSVSKDKTVRTWNLIQGRLAFVTNLKEAANLVKWSPNGENFFLSYNKRIDIYDKNNCGIIKSINIEEGISCVKWLNENTIIVGKENGYLTFLNIEEEIYSFKAHEKRIKDFGFFTGNFFEKENLNIFITTISSDGYVKLLGLNLKNKTYELLAEKNSNCRLNCLAIYQKTPLVNNQLAEKKTLVNKSNIKQKNKKLKKN